MENFWKNYEDIKQKLLILLIITFIIFYINIHYNKIPRHISDHLDEKYVKSSL